VYIFVLTLDFNLQSSIHCSTKKHRVVIGISYTLQTATLIKSTSFTAENN